MRTSDAGWTPSEAAAASSGTPSGSRASSSSRSRCAAADGQRRVVDRGADELLAEHDPVEVEHALANGCRDRPPGGRPGADPDLVRSETKIAVVLRADLAPS